MCGSCVDHLGNMWGPCGDHVGIMCGSCQSCGDHLGNMWGSVDYVWIIYRSCGIMWGSFGDHSGIMCESCMYHASIMLGSFMDHSWIMWGSYGDYVGIVPIKFDHYVDRSYTLWYTWTITVWWGKVRILKLLLDRDVMGHGSLVSGWKSYLMGRWWWQDGNLLYHMFIIHVDLLVRSINPWK